MNTNQESAKPSGTNPFASVVLQNFFSKKSAMSDEKISENVSQVAAESDENAQTVSQILTRLENKKEWAAVNLGIGANEVETIPFDLSQLETEGIFLNIDCSGFGALSRQLEWETYLRLNRTSPRFPWKKGKTKK